MHPANTGRFSLHLYFLTAPPFTGRVGSSTPRPALVSTVKTEGWTVAMSTIKGRADILDEGELARAAPQDIVTKGAA